MPACAALPSRPRAELAGAAAPRIAAFDGVRGLASLGVLLHHLLLRIDINRTAAGRWLHHTPFRVLETGRPMVLCFFVLSGLVLTRALLRMVPPLTARLWFAYAAQRMVRLCLPALASVALSALLMALCYRHADWGGNAWLSADGWNGREPWRELAADALLLGTDHTFRLNNVLWSLVHELRLSCLLPLVAAARAGIGPLPLIALAAALAGAAMALGAVRNEVLLGSDWTGNVVASAYFALPFAVGAALALHDGGWQDGDGHVAAPRLLRRCAIVAILLAMSAPSDAMALLGAALILWLARQPGRFAALLISPAIAWLGRISFSLYLVHLPILMALTQALSASPPALVLIATVPLSLAAAAAMQAAVEAPAHRLARRIGRRAAA